MINTQLAQGYLETFLHRTTLLGDVNTNPQDLSVTQLHNFAQRFLIRAVENAHPIVEDGLLNKDLSRMAACSMLTVCRSKFANVPAHADVFKHYLHPLILYVAEEGNSLQPVHAKGKLTFPILPETWRSEIEFWRDQLTILCSDNDPTWMIRHNSIFRIEWALWDLDAGYKNRLPVTRIGVRGLGPPPHTLSNSGDYLASFGFKHQIAKPIFP